LGHARGYPRHVSAQRRCPRRSRTTGALCTFEDVDRRIVVPIERETTPATGDPTDGQRDLVRELLTAPCTGLGCVRGIYEAYLSPGAFSLGDEVCREVRPARVHNTFAEVVVLDHAGDTEVFERDGILTLHTAEAMGFLLLPRLGWDCERRAHRASYALSTSV